LTLLHATTLYCTLLHCRSATTTRYYTLLYCTLPHSTALCRTLPRYATRTGRAPDFACLYCYVCLKGVCVCAHATYARSRFMSLSHVTVACLCRMCLCRRCMHVYGGGRKRRILFVFNHTVKDAGRVDREYKEAQTHQCNQ